MSRIKALFAIVFGLVAWYAVAIATDYLLTRELGLERGMRYAVLGAAQLTLGGAAIWLAARMARLRPAELGFTTQNMHRDVTIGLGIAIAFAVLQFGLIIPATGGAERSDIVANNAQLGDAPSGLAGFLVLALLGSTAEELLFRGLMLGGIALVLGGGVASRITATVIVVVLFALGHGYQGWAGVIDTGIYGGLTLSLLYWWRGARLAAPIAAHVGWNAIAAVTLFTIY